jgi:predicted dehydrogenase
VAGQVAHVGARHTLLFLEPGHFHAALTLRVPQARAADEIVVYAREGREFHDFLTLVDRFNGRAERPTRWRPTVVVTDDPLERLLDERRGDVVVLAGRNRGKARAMRSLHDAGFHVLADKPWLVEPEDLDAVRASLAAPPVAAEIMTGRLDVAAGVMRRLVATPVLFGTFVEEAPGLDQESVHHLEKLVDGAPLRRPWWYFDVRVQGSGPVDVPTHLVDQAQWMSGDDGALLTLLSADAWSTAVPVEAFRRVTGEHSFPEALAPFVDGDTLDYRCNAEVTYRVGRITAHARTEWALSAPPGGGDSTRHVAHGTRADVRLEQSGRTGHRRRVFVEPRGDAAGIERTLCDLLATWQAELPGAEVVRAGADGFEVRLPPALDGGHETHFARVLDELLTAIDEGRWPADVAERTLAKYTLLAEAAARTR